MQRLTVRRFVRVTLSSVLWMWCAGDTMIAYAQVQPMAQPSEAYAPQAQPSRGLESQAGRWGGGTGLGLLFDSPDGTAIAWNSNLDYFLTDYFSIGPLLQFGFTGDMVQTGLSGQGKYWIPVSNRGRLNLQAGVGFVHTDFRANDTSWLVPLGVGYEYAISPAVNLTATALVNLTDLHTGGGSGADVMPGLLFGIQF